MEEEEQHFIIQPMTGEINGDFGHMQIVILDWEGLADFVEMITDLDLMHLPINFSPIFPEEFNSDYIPPPHE